MLTLLTLIGLVVGEADATDELAADAAGASLPADPSADDLAAETTLTDPLADPWFAEDGPAVAPVVEVPRERVAADWAEATPTPAERTAILRRTRLELGLGDLAAPAAVIQATASDEQPERFTALARDLAPGRPAFQFAHALALWRSGDIGASIGAVGATLWAMAVSVPAQLWLVENATVLLAIVMLAASLGFVFLAALQVLPHAGHDMGDLLSGKTPAFAGVAAVVALVTVPFVFGEGLAGLALALFTLAFAYGNPSQRNALALAAMLLIIAMGPLMQTASVVTQLLDRDPVARSVLAVVQGFETQADVERLERAVAEDRAAAHALAYRARRQGLEAASLARLDAIIEQYPADGVALANRGNIERRRDNTAEAIRYYERAAAQIESPTLLFNLGAAYASAFRMEEYETSLVRAQRLDAEAVAALSSLDDAALVADLAFPMSLVRTRLIEAGLSTDHPIGPAIRLLAPGWLGARWFYLPVAFMLATLLCLLFSKRWDHASLCVRCGHRICTRCEETVWSDEICEDCHHLFQYPEATDPSLRMARLQALSERETRIDRLLLGLSLLIPGVAGFAARRPDLAMFGLLSFSWLAAWITWPRGVFADPLLMGKAAFVCFAVPGVLAIVAYVGVVLFSMVVRKAR